MNKKGENILSHLNKQILGEQLKWVYSMQSTIELNLRRGRKLKWKIERKSQVNVVGIMIRKNRKVLPNHNISRMNYYILKCSDTMWVICCFCKEKNVVLTNQVKDDPFEAVRQYLQSQTHSEEFIVCSLLSQIGSGHTEFPLFLVWIWIYWVQTRFSSMELISSAFQQWVFRICTTNCMAIKKKIWWRKVNY